ncbi:DUF2169 family type VI secretion system accessory protein [Pseudoalteromonas denitrificans]|uniref:DUF2169 domain-containing protein n=1 Tax=Pseudoalteromonas denitrificans DSM 6059 TaxID=1123010 RepID=A0A1I1NEL3_9GAMM|nr:DUF2169 domain-containing protein [Pseudoalteromonas denitrificans]SFC95935.1 hypothetical protein SAMN02745724_03042 [Pseudoalteromonas denitrificans DSM 6059]
MLHNTSSWQADFTTGFSKTADEIISIIVKQSFEFDDQGNVFEKQPCDAIISSDEHHGDPHKTSLKAANELVPFKRGFEFYGNFSAYPPKGISARVVEVTCKLITHNQKKPEIEKILRITGQRNWKKSLLGTVASDPQILSNTQINYENAFGGINQLKPEQVYGSNPVGRGYKLKSKNAKLQQLPTIELASYFIKRPGKEVPTGGFGAIPLFWSPRSDNIPDIAQPQLMAGKFPYKTPLPDDFYNTAPQDQQTDILFSEGCFFTMSGLLPNLDYRQEVKILLPFDKPVLKHIKEEGMREKLDMQCDTLVIEGDEQSFSLIWRAQIKKSDCGLAPQFSIEKRPKNKVVKTKVLQTKDIT